MTDVITTADESRLAEVVEQALAEARRAGASQAEAEASHDAGLTVTARMREIETIEYQNDRGLGVTVYVGRHKGSASSSDFAPEAIAETVRRAAAIARETAPDEHAGLADADEMASEVPDLALDHPWPLDPDAARDLALRCEARALDADERIANSEGASVSTSRGGLAYGNTHGFTGGFRRSSHSLSCAVLARDDGGMERDYHYSAARDPAALESAEEVGRRAAERTLRRLGARKLGTRKAPVLFPPELAAGLLAHFVSAVSGHAQYRRATFLLEAAGQQIFPSFFSLRERPHLRAALGSEPFDREGVATRDRDLVAEGVLTGYVLSSYSARRLGLKTTGNAGGIHNLLADGGEGDLASLIAAMPRGLVVGELMGQGVNPVTGDYSRGASGFWVERGEIVHPVHEITIAGNLLDMYRNLAAAGADLDTRDVIRAGSLLIEEMTIAGD